MASITCLLRIKILSPNSMQRCLDGCILPRDVMHMTSSHTDCICRAMRSFGSSVPQNKTVKMVVSCCGVYLLPADNTSAVRGSESPVLSSSPSSRGARDTFSVVFRLCSSEHASRIAASVVICSLWMITLFPDSTNCKDGKDFKTLSHSEQAEYYESLSPRKAKCILCREASNTAPSLSMTEFWVQSFNCLNVWECEDIFGLHFFLIGRLTCPLKICFFFLQEWWYWTSLAIISIPDILCSIEESFYVLAAARIASDAWKDSQLHSFSLVPNFPCDFHTFLQNKTPAEEFQNLMRIAWLSLISGYVVLFQQKNPPL